MVLICNTYLCIVDTVDGGLREYFKDKIYNVTKQGNFYLTNGYLLTERQVINNFMTVYEYKNNIINKIINE